MRDLRARRARPQSPVSARARDRIRPHPVPRRRAGNVPPGRRAASRRPAQIGEAPLRLPHFHRRESALAARHGIVRRQFEVTPPAAIESSSAPRSPVAAASSFCTSARSGASRAACASLPPPQIPSADSRNPRLPAGTTRPGSAAAAATPPRTRRARGHSDRPTPPRPRGPPGC